MDPSKLFSDKRFIGVCVYCGCATETFDHAPSKVLLDEPYPDCLPGVGSCLQCNYSFSLDEEYFACFIECVISGTTEPANLSREKIKKILTRKPALATQIGSACKTNDEGRLVWEVDMTRASNVVMKLARAHVAYENCDPMLYPPETMLLRPLCLMSDEEYASFESPDTGFPRWPEVGSRAFMRACGAGHDRFTANGWEVIQRGRYRYRVDFERNIVARMVISEYLACTVAW